MSTLDPAKLKVVELRQELTSRGLDAKGNKPVLVKRLKEALEQELQKEIPDTSIADTSTEDLNTSQESATDEVVPSDPPDKGDGPAEDVSAEAEEEEEKQEEPLDKVEELPKPSEQEEDEQETKASSETPEEQSAQLEKPVVQESSDSTPKEPEDVQMAAPVEENGENVDQEMRDDSQTDKVAEAPEQPAVEASDNKTATDEPRGEKRRRTSPSPERVQRKRSKSPIKEDEPIIDNNKVQLSWYDSDLHLIVDKKSFLSGKPYHEGAFGYAWAGVRTTHGAKSGKVCYEVKITEELKWEDPVKQSERKRDRHDNSKKDRQRGSSKNLKGSHDNTKSKDKENKEKTEDSNKEESKVNSESSEEKPKEEKSEDVDMEKSQTDDTVEKTNEAVEEKAKEAVEEKAKEAVEEKAKEAVEEKAKEAVEEKTNEAVQEKPNETVDEKPTTADESSDVSKVESSENEVSKDEKSGEAVASEGEKKEGKHEPMEVDETPIEPISKHVFRVGWSLQDTALQLGEAEYSYGYDSTGKFVSNKQFTDYAIKYNVGDVIGAYLDIQDETVTFTFTVNGALQPQAASIPRSELPQENLAFFPHILTRNCAFELNLGSQEEPWFPGPTELSDYAFIENIEDKQAGPTRPELRSECEVIMMCGLPAAGKTEWVGNMIKENPDKRFTIIGNSHLLEKMTVNGNPLKNSYKSRWNVVLDRLMKCVNVLVETAALRRRNFVIDQTNVFPSAQRRKMRLFEGFKRRAVVVVVGDEEQAKRRALQEAQDGKDVPDSAILEMKANMSLPRRGDWLEEVTYVELGEEEAKALVQKYNQQGREAGFGPISGQRSGYHRDNRGHPYRWDHSKSRRDYRSGGYRDNRSYQNNRYDRSRQQGWQNRRPPPGSWNRDVRRDRGPGGGGSSSGGSGGGGGSRDFRNNNRSSGSRPDRSNNRDNRNRSQSSSNYRVQRSQSNRNQPANWQGSSGSSGSWGGGANQSWGGQGMWNQGNWSQGGGWNSGSGQAQGWKGSYGQSGYGQGGYGSYANWNYYGQYPQNWNSQGQPHTTSAGGTAATDNMNQAYNQYSQQAAWAQYAQQYAQQGQTYTSSTTTTQQPSIQK